MTPEVIAKILALGEPNIKEFGDLSYTDKTLHLVQPPLPAPVECSTLQGLVDLFQEDLDEVDEQKILIHITSPTTVEIISKDADEYGRRRVWAEADYPEVKTFPFGNFLDPEAFIISAQQHFQRVKVENDDGTFAKDLDYVLKIASKITAEHAAENSDDGFAQRVAVKQGIALKEETILQPMVNLAPYRTFAEIDQVISRFVFRARILNGTAVLALFEGDGGRWKIGATAAIKAWLEPKVGNVPVIS